MDVYESIKRLFGWGAKPARPLPPAERPTGEVPIVTAEIANERREKPRTNARNRTRMLVIDDSATIVALLSRMLRQNDYEVLEAADAEAGLELAPLADGSYPGVVALERYLDGR